eukprot:GFUD01117057.1.p1 GENE.GFUD01117057.1~~GFUD01117057.1.p1  ORF type:complete len:271 (-),score=89.59 GFUD01117057.1:1-813(-)
MAKVRKPPVEKISELEFEIRILEQSQLSDREAARLNNLKVKRELDKTLGLKVRQTVPVNLLPRLVPQVLETEDWETEDLEPEDSDVGVSNSEVENGAPEKKIRKRKKAANGFNFYVKKIRQALREDNPGATLNMETVQSTWSKMPSDEKVRFNKLSQEELNDCDDTVEDKLKAKKERDSKYRQKKSEENRLNETEVNVFREDFAKVLDEKKIKVDILKNVKETLENEHELNSAELGVVSKMIIDQDKEEQSLKSRQRDLYSHHKKCKSIL